GAIGDIDRVADVVAMTMREHDMRDPFDRCPLVGIERRVAGEERIDQNGCALEIEPKGGVPVPGDLHGACPVMRMKVMQDSRSKCGINSGRTTLVQAEAMIGSTT